MWSILIRWTPYDCYLAYVPQYVRSTVNILVRHTWELARHKQHPRSTTKINNMFNLAGFASHSRRDEGDLKLDLEI